MACHTLLWTETRSPVKQADVQVHRLQIPLHMGIDGNDKADHLADVGHRKSRFYLDTSPFP